MAREVEDIEALIVEAGWPAHLYGVSSGGALALETAAAGADVDRVAVHEVPYNMDDDRPRRWRECVERLGAVLAEDRRGDALEVFMRVTGASDEEVAGARSSPFWPGSEALAHTLAYDAACMGDGQPPTERFARITQPTLVATASMRVNPRPRDGSSPSIRPPTRSPRASRTLSVRSSKVSRTWPTRARSRPNSKRSSELDGA